MKISVSSYSFYQYIHAGKLTHMDTVKQAHDMGFDAIEFLDMPAPDYEGQVAFAYQLRNEAEKYGMTINAFFRWHLGVGIAKGSRRLPFADHQSRAKDERWGLGRRENFGV